MFIYRSVCWNATEGKGAQMASLALNSYILKDASPSCVQAHNILMEGAHRGDHDDLVLYASLSKNRAFNHSLKQKDKKVQ